MPDHDLVLGRTNEEASNQGRTMAKRYFRATKLRANNVTALHGTAIGRYGVIKASEKHAVTVGC